MLSDEINKLKTLINSIIITNSYNSCDYTVRQKNLMCQSYLEILELFPEQMVNYCLKDIRGSHLQNKIFKKYIEILEKSLPLNFSKGKNKYVVSSLTDKDLNIFSDLDSFEQIVNNKNKIKNNSSKFYIGGRKASYVKPYYIGKLIDVIEIKTGKSLLSRVEDYTFSYIKVKNIKFGTEVKVIYLPVPPHYQMGPMVYLNRIKKELKKIR